MTSYLSILLALVLILIAIHYLNVSTCKTSLDVKATWLLIAFGGAKYCLDALQQCHLGNVHKLDHVWLVLAFFGFIYLYVLKPYWQKTHPLPETRIKS